MKTQIHCPNCKKDVDIRVSDIIDNYVDCTFCLHDISVHELPIQIKYIIPKLLKDLEKMVKK